ncbi:MAG TPA: hypothetical protein VGK61_10425, partial [Planctomycetota bacterium]
ELLLMGPRALPFLREELAGSDGDLKSRLDSLIGKIERNRRQAAAQGKTLLVRLTAEESLITTLLADIQKSTGVPIENRSPPSYATATVAGDGISLWDAVDRICKTHGQLTWDISQWGIVVRGEPYAPPPMALNSGYAFLFREFVRTSAGRDGKNVGLQSEAYVAGPPGVVTAAAYLTYDALTDDRGTDLLKGPKGTPIDPVTKGFNLLAEPDMRYPLFVHLVDLLAPSPGHAATRVKTCKGVAIVRAVVDLKKTVELRGPALKKGAKASASGLSIRIEEFTLAGGHLKIEMDITDTRGSGKKDRNLPYPQAAGKVVVRDADGRDVALALSPGVGPLPVKGPGGTSANEVARYRVEGTLKADLSVVAIEVWEPSEVEEIKIPFDLKDIPFRRR